MFKVEFKTGNAAFEEDNGRYEIARILKVIADKLLDGENKGSIRDYNGNHIGDWKL